jgi:ubiquinone/menaquinone biosynthesis C-methylase UbiE
MEQSQRWKRLSATCQVTISATLRRENESGILKASLVMIAPIGVVSIQTLNSQYLYAQTLRAALPGVRRWLDLGCGHQFLPDWVQDASPTDVLDGITTVGIDLDLDAIRKHPDLKQRVIADIEHLPVASDTFDLVTANMVIEHVRQPELLFREVSRVMASGGSFLVHTPNVTGYTTRLARCVPSILRPAVARILHDRHEEDVYPTHYRANSIAELERVALRCGLTVSELATVNSSAQFFKIPVVGRLEERLLQFLAQRRMSRWQPCIIGRFRKSRPDPSTFAGT